MMYRLPAAVLVPALTLLAPACDSEKSAAPAGETDGADDTDGAGPCEAGDSQPCEDPGTIQYCLEDGTWGVCVDEATSCTPGDTTPDPCGGPDAEIPCVLAEDGTPIWDEGVTCGEGTTPLVLVPAGVRPRFLPAGGASFAFAGPDAMRCLSTDWPTADTPWLARDLDGDGAIDGGHELFGSATRLPDGRTAPHGFAALTTLDGNGDGVLDARDPAFADLVLWADRDGDRRSTPDELSPLAAAGVRALPLAYRVEPRCDTRGNCGRERAAVDATAPATLVDVHLRCR